MDATTLLSQIRAGKPSPAYLFVGSEEYLLQSAVDALIRANVDPATREFNLDVFYGKDVDGGKVLDVVNAYPMMADKRVVVVKNVFALSTTVLEQLARYLAKPCSSTILILMSDKADFRKKVVSEIKKRTHFIEFKPLYDNQVPSWVKSYLKEKGMEIGQEAVLLIQSRIGNNLRSMVNELDKILLNMDGRKRIDLDDVNRVVGFSRSYTVFDLNDAIGYKDLNKALQILNRMLENGESPTGLVAMINRHMISLVKLKGALREGRQKAEIARISGIPPFFIDKSRTMAENFSDTELNSVFDRLLETDLMLKTSKLPPDIALQTLLIQIMGNRVSD